jgi:hypothetical protein
VFEATVKLTVPGPLPLAPVVTVIHGTVLAAVHAQPPVVAIDTGGAAPPVAGIANARGVTV